MRKLKGVLLCITSIYTSHNNNILNAIPCGSGAASVLEDHGGLVEQEIIMKCRSSHAGRDVKRSEVASRAFSGISTTLKQTGANSTTLARLWMLCC